MDRLASMATFVKVVDLGSFAAAASALMMSPADGGQARGVAGGAAGRPAAPAHDAPSSPDRDRQDLSRAMQGGARRSRLGRRGGGPGDGHAARSIAGQRPGGVRDAYADARHHPLPAPASGSADRAHAQRPLRRSRRGGLRSRVPDRPAGRLVVLGARASSVPRGRLRFAGLPAGTPGRRAFPPTSSPTNASATRARASRRPTGASCATGAGSTSGAAAGCR